MAKICRLCGKTLDGEILFGYHKLCAKKTFDPIHYNRLLQWSEDNSDNRIIFESDLEKGRAPQRLKRKPEKKYPPQVYIKPVSKVNDKKRYYHLLKKASEEEEEYEDIKHLPEFYILLTNIISDPKCGWLAKMMINSALAYLVIPDDIISDEKEEWGYVDDLFICVYVLKQIRDNFSKELILSNLGDTLYENEGENIFEIIYEVYNSSKNFLKEEVDTIISYTHIKEILSFGNKDSEKNINPQAKGLKKYNELKREKWIKLYTAMTAVVVDDFIKKSSENKQGQRIKEYIKSTPEYGELQRNIALIEK